MKKILYILLLMLIPIRVSASTILSSENNKPTVGAIIDVSVDIDYGTTKISSSHYKISYDNECISLSDLKWEQSQGVYSLNS